ncbi:GATA zinc finger protein [Quillaja saponaria]|uniref:GATA zinc finger protein n=1 Tax=Quillaja saponaria TaxID=32244 RepID=A0AAD7Q7A3_QUISA|nr:GATA zinc finger protein [Quillaja saponaria]
MMTDESENLDPKFPEPNTRPVGGTEYSWCKAVPSGTGITVLGVLLSKPPDIPTFQNALRKLQNSHHILRSKLRLDITNNTFSFLTHPTPYLQITPFDLQSTSLIIKKSESNTYHISPFHLLHEHELNQNTWRDHNHSLSTGFEVFCASIYTISETQWALFLRLHTSVCDRAAAVAILRELFGQLGNNVNGRGSESERTEMVLRDENEISLGIEDLIPAGKANKPFWARGLDVLGYSLNSLRLSNLDFKDTDSTRGSHVVRLQMSPYETERLLAECKSREIKLCGTLAAAGMLAAHSSKHLPDHQREKYAVVTLVDLPLDS